MLILKWITATCLPRLEVPKLLINAVVHVPMLSPKIIYRAVANGKTPCEAKAINTPIVADELWSANVIINPSATPNSGLCP